MQTDLSKIKGRKGATFSVACWRVHTLPKDIQIKKNTKDNRCYSSPAKIQTLKTKFVYNFMKKQKLLCKDRLHHF